MRITKLLKTGLITGLLTGLAAFAPKTFAQQNYSPQTYSQQPISMEARSPAVGSDLNPPGPDLNSKDVNSARDALASARNKVLRVGKRIHHTRLDCSHLVHDLYRRAGIAYEYVNSEQLYDGAPGFRQVEEPVAGDIIVWRGHMGVIVDPLLHSFLSGLRTGVKIAEYDSRYWKNRGVPRFFRYTGGEDVVDLSRQVRVARNHISRVPALGE
jgi:cell wall-associated NlpC family hydrolase